MKTIKLLDIDELLMLSISDLLELDASYHIGNEFFMTDNYDSSHSKICCEDCGEWTNV